MSVKIEPKGNNRSITRQQYKTANKIIRKFNYDNKEKLDQAFMNMLIYGESFVKYKENGEIEVLTHEEILKHTQEEGQE